MSLVHRLINRMVQLNENTIMLLKLAWQNDEGSADPEDDLGAGDSPGQSATGALD